MECEIITRCLYKDDLCLHLIAIFMSRSALEYVIIMLLQSHLYIVRGGSSHKESNTMESLITHKRTCQLLIYTPSQWYSRMSRPSRSALGYRNFFQIRTLLEFLKEGLFSPWMRWVITTMYMTPSIHIMV